MGCGCLSRLFMLKAFFSALICSLVLVGQVYAQEVIVAFLGPEYLKHRLLFF